MLPDKPDWSEMGLLQIIEKKRKADLTCGFTLIPRIRTGIIAMPSRRAIGLIP